MSRYPAAVKRSLLLLTTVATVTGLFAAIWLATPANAVPEGWSDPEPVSWTNALLVLVVAPSLLFALIAFVTSLPHFVKRATDEEAPDTRDDTPEIDASADAPELDASVGAPQLQAPAAE